MNRKPMERLLHRVRRCRHNSGIPSEAFGRSRKTSWKRGIRGGFYRMDEGH